MEIEEVEAMKQRMRQLARAGLPFNPLSALAITGANVQRLQKSMDSFGWTDQRFVLAEQALANGWIINKGTENVMLTDRDEKTGATTTYAMFNASSVLGMPSLEEMLQMDNSAFLAMRGISPPEPTLPTELQAAGVETGSNTAEIVGTSNAINAPAATSEQGIDEEDDGIEVGPAHTQKLTLEGTDVAQADLTDQVQPGPVRDLFLDEEVQGMNAGAPEQGAQSIDWSDEPDPEPEQFAVSAPYWLDGLHNFEGLKLAEEINRLIEEKNLEHKKDAVDSLLATYPDKLKFELAVVDKNKHELNPHRKANLAEPAILLKGALIRDKEGKYRPKEGGLPIIEDKGTSLKLKRKNGKAYEAAMELALAKGWKAIELNGNPKMLGQAWLEAQMRGLDVVNYSPSEKDREALAQRIAERDAAMAKERGPETVEVRPVIDSDGREGMAQVTTTVEQQAEPSGKPSQQSTVTRTTTRLQDVVRTDVHPGVVPKATGKPRTDKNIVQREIAEAVAEVKDTEQGVFDMEKGGVLVEQGTAPYNHNPKAKASPYAVLTNDAGVSHTFWGQDLPRSIEEAGVVVGDKISLIPGERTPVNVPIREADGTERIGTFNRVSWETNVLAKAKSIEAPPPEIQKTVEQGLHIGTVMAIKDGMIGQKTGRDPNKLVWHSLEKMDGPVPEVGAMVEIGYSNGKAKVMTKELERGVSR